MLSRPIPIRSRHFGHHTALPLIRTVLGPPGESDMAVRASSVMWRIYEVDAVSFGTRFVMLQPSASVCAKGIETLQNQIGDIIAMIGTCAGFPREISKSSALPSNQTRSAWLLRCPDNVFYLISYDPHTKRVETDLFFSLDGVAMPGSLDALSLVFPVNAREAVKELDTEPL